MTQRILSIRALLVHWRTVYRAMILAFVSSILISVPIQALRAQNPAQMPINPDTGEPFVTFSVFVDEVSPEIRAMTPNEKARWEELQEQSTKDFEAENYAAALEAADEILALERATFGPEHPHIIGTLSLKASILAAQKPSKAIENLEQSIALALKQLDSKHPFVIQSRLRLANYLNANSDFEAAWDLGQINVGFAEAVYGKESRAYLSVKSTLARSLQGLEKSQSAQEILQDIFETSKRVNGEEAEDTLAHQTNLAVAYYVSGKITDAIALAEAAYQISRRVNGDAAATTKQAQKNLNFFRSKEASTPKRRTENYPTGLPRVNQMPINPETGERFRSVYAIAADTPPQNRLLTNEELAKVKELNAAISSAAAAKQLRVAEPLLRQLLDLYAENFGLDHPGMIPKYQSLGSLLLLTGKNKEALATMQRGISLSERYLPSNHPSALLGESGLGAFYIRSGRVPEAISTLEPAASGLEEILGPSHILTLTSRSALAEAVAYGGDYEAALALVKRITPVMERTLGKDAEITIQTKLRHAAILQRTGLAAEGRALIAPYFESLDSNSSSLTYFSTKLLTVYGELLVADGDLTTAGRVIQRAVRENEALHGAVHPDTLMAKRAQAALLSERGDVLNSRKLIEDIIGQQRAVLGETHPETLFSIRMYGTLLVINGRYSEAERVLNSAVRLFWDALGRDHPLTLATVKDYASVTLLLKRPERALFYLEEGFAVARQTLPPSSNEFHYLSYVFAIALAANGRFEEAENVLSQVLQLHQTYHVNRTSDEIVYRITYGDVLIQLGKIEIADIQFRRAHELATQTLSPGQPQALAAAISLAFFELSHGSTAATERDTFNVARRAVEGVRTRLSLLGYSAQETQQRIRTEDRLSGVFKVFADAAWAAVQSDKTAANLYKPDAYLALQDATRASPSRALSEAAARRFAQKQSGLGGLARKRQELNSQWEAAEKAFTEAFGVTGESGENQRNNARARMDALEAEMNEIDAQLRDRAPEYFALTRPEALSVAQAQGLLSPTEAALMLVPTDLGTHAMVVSDEGISWHRSDLSWGEIDGLVAKLRRDLDPDPPEHSARGDLTKFDRATAYTLFRELILPLQESLKEKEELYVVTSGALSSLPLGVLVTEEPKGNDADPAALRATSWLADRYALVQLPSLQSLQLLRQFNPPDETPRSFQPGHQGVANRVFAGFGDPILEGTARQRGVRSGDDLAAATDIYASGRTDSGAAIADVDQIRKLSRLPGTAAELLTISDVLGASEDTVHLGEDANEMAVRSADLSKVAIIAFATHGLLAGEVDGIAEPALVLTPPDTPNEANDGLITASEIATLRLNADWIILSACNTAAGDNAGGAGLSGLARSFFYAGARSLLASHWPVRDDIAPNISTGILLARQIDPSLSRAKALQIAMQRVRNSLSDPTTAHPAAWAPFTLVGEGR